MAKPYLSFSARALAGRIMTLVLVLVLVLPTPLFAESQADPELLPAPPQQPDTMIELPVLPHGTEAFAPGEASPVREVPPVTETPGIFERLLPSEPPSVGAEERSEPLEVPTMVSEPAEPIAPPPTTRLTVTLDWYLNPQHAALLVAREKGMFARRGLDVSLVVPADPSVTTKLLTAGRTDLAVGRQPQLHLLADKGAPLIRVATLVATPVSALVLRDEFVNEKRELSLEGLRIGVTDIDGRDALLASMLTELLGLANGQELVELHDISYSVLDAMREQRVDGVLAHHRYLLPRQLADEGVMTRMLPVEQHGLPSHDGLILMANRDQLNGKRDVVRRLVLALEEAALWIVNQPHEAWALLQAAEPALADQASEEAWGDVFPRLSLQPAAVDHGRYLHFEQFLFEAGVTEAVTPLERLAIDLGTAAP
ncbi:ABC transporter substrate-binding protein [Halomonas sp. MCCC 1A11036]|uniref:ABC transporter substrate-binding protein n=1 Tax=Billgrantia zhangzhouensis TaxID=2733481 RepID=A0ABS9AB50_9GAMM|nr:ABC transporter substrate-binding protein [Halomonas zhangzhouensis]MCE8019104.1 ABC transporter substrate-binding protein [Halomonas zhangzhouensis]